MHPRALKLSCPTSKARSYRVSWSAKLKVLDLQGCMCLVLIGSANGYEKLPTTCDFYVTAVTLMS